MPTYNRRRFVGQAVWYFLRQDYPNKELIVLDDGEDAVADLVPPDERIRYVRLDRRLPLGAKRNAGCEMARGECIAHWDDDDWIAPDRLSAQVRHLLASRADVCGTTDLLHYGLESGEAWLYRHAPDGRPWLAGGTLLYRREAWSRVPFRPINVGEDTEFIHRQPPDRVSAIGDAPFYVALIHRGNTSAKRLTDSHWERRTMDSVSQLLSLDRDFYVGLRNGRTAQQSAARRRSTECVTVGAPFIVYDGYGSMAEFLVLGMERAGATVNVIPLQLDPNGISDELRRCLQRSRPDPVGPALYFCWPRSDLERFRKLPELFIYTMWESSRLPADWPERLNETRAVIVPTRFVERVCRESGVRRPLEVVPLGVDPDIYHYIERPERERLTTLVVGTVIERKHVREAIAAWNLAFANDRNARLIIKARFHYGNYRPDDPRITLVDDNEPTRGIAHWYEQADVVIAAGNEGFGLPLVEGMATGLPVIALGSEGQGDTCEDAGPERLLPVAPARWEQYDEPTFGRCGIRGVPAPEDLADRLRWVADHRDDARAMGRAASQWVLEHRNVWNTGPAVLDALERHVTPARPLRRLHTFWVPSWETACGIAEYTALLKEHIRDLRVEPRMPNLQRVRTLHIQHEPSLFNDAELTTSVHRARLERIPVAITEHAVRPVAVSCEREADVLVAHTAEGADVLRARWPGKRVEHIPHGCPTWFPPRRRERGRVIGAFGFLERYKGFWRLLDALRALPDTELVLVSHARRPENEPLWAEAAAGLPVRRYSNLLPVAEAAALLAAEADILVYWYDEVPHLSASGAVRVGLATGVPILASPTNWFRDVRNATYQPHDLVEGIRRLLDDTALRDSLTSAARDHCHENRWAKAAERHVALWRSMEALN